MFSSIIVLFFKYEKLNPIEESCLLIASSLWNAYIRANAFTLVSGAISATSAITKKKDIASQKCCNIVLT